MVERRKTTERLVGLACLAVLLFNPPLLSLFSVDRTLLGAPALFIYVYLAWIAVIVLIALSTRWVLDAASRGGADRD